jgi:hypothetical protein
VRGRRRARPNVAQAACRSCGRVIIFDANEYPGGLEYCPSLPLTDPVTGERLRNEAGGLEMTPGCEPTVDLPAAILGPSAAADYVKLLERREADRAAHKPPVTPEDLDDVNPAGGGLKPSRNRRTK